MDEYLTLNQGVDEFESLPEHMESIKDAEKMIKIYQKFQKKTGISCLNQIHYQREFIRRRKYELKRALSLVG